jgi:hypothetical protein
MRGRLRQLFFVLTDDLVGSGPRPEPNSLQDPPTSYPQAELVEQAVANIQQDHMYTASPASTPPPAAKPSGSLQSDTPGSKRKSSDPKAGNSKRRWYAILIVFNYHVIVYSNC